jgi:hypothetical protein
LAVESADNMWHWDKYVYAPQCIIGTNGSHVSESLSCETANTLKSLVFLKLQGQKQMKGKVSMTF